MNVNEKCIFYEDLYFESFEEANKFLVDYDQSVKITYHLKE